MTQSALHEAAGVIYVVTDALITCAPAASAGGANLRQACGWLRANAVLALQSGNIGAPLLSCFQAATAAGATVDGFGFVRSKITGIVTVSALAGVVAQAALCMNLAEEVRAISFYDFTSRDDVEARFVAMNLVFDAAVDFAAASPDATSYRALVVLRAAMARDLALRGWPLPFLSNFALPRGFPALFMANRLYGDAGRSDELTAENKWVHPLFGMAAGRALSG